jgi:hypothetical protein
MMLRLLFFGILVFACIIETQDAMFTDGRSFQDVRDKLLFLFENLLFKLQILDENISKAMTKVSKKLQDKLDVLKDNKYAIKLWKLYKKYYHKNYSTPDEEKERLGKFLDNLKLIIQENFRFDEGAKSFKLQLNQFGDMNLDEFRQKLTGLNADGQGEKASGEVIQSPTTERIKRFLVDSIKKKIKKKLSFGKKRPSNSGMYITPGSSGTRLNPSARRPTSRLSSKAAVDYRQYMNPIENQGRCGLVLFLFLKHMYISFFKDHVMPLLLHQQSKVHMH